MRSKFITGFRLKIIDSLERGQIVVAYDFKSPEIPLLTQTPQKQVKQSKDGLQRR
jgi:hypothetical protein